MLSLTPSRPTVQPSPSGAREVRCSCPPIRCAGPSMSVPPTSSPRRAGSRTTRPRQNSHVPRRNQMRTLGLQRIWHPWRSTRHTFPQPTWFPRPTGAACGPRDLRHEPAHQRRFRRHGRCRHHARAQSRQHGRIRLPAQQISQAHHQFHVPHDAQSGRRRRARPGGLSCASTAHARPTARKPASAPGSTASPPTSASTMRATPATSVPPPPFTSTKPTPRPAPRPTFRTARRASKARCCATSAWPPFATSSWPCRSASAWPC